MEQTVPDEPPPDDLGQELTSDSLAPLRKRQRQNLQDVSNTKPLAPIRTSGRIRIKMTAAAELKPPEPTLRPVKVLNNNSNSNKQRRRPKKLKTDLVSELSIDVKRPSSVLVDTSIRALLTNVAFAQLSPENQKILIESLPLVDRPSAPSKENQSVDLKPSSINNEFFNRACIEWRDRLSNGEFTNEHQTKLRAEHEREKSKIDPWKARNFEGIWGIKTNGHGAVNVGAMMEKSALEMKERVEQGDFEIPEGFINEVWKRNEHEEEIEEDIKIESDIKMNSNEENWKIVSPPSYSSPSQNPSVSTSVPTPPEIVTSTQTEILESSSVIDETTPASQLSSSRSSKPFIDQPVIAEATSSADDNPVLESNSPEPSTSDFIADDDYTGDIASHVEISSDEVPTRWYHQQEHDYLRNVIEPESSGMEEELGGSFESESIENVVEENLSENADEVDRIMEINNGTHDYNVTRLMNNVSRIVDGNSRINSYDTELPQEIFHKPEDAATSYQRNNATSVLVNNYMHHQEPTPVVVRQVINPTTTRFNTVLMQEEQNDQGSYHNESYMVEENEIIEPKPYRGKIRSIE